MKDIKQQTKEHNRLIYYLCLFNLIFVTFACQQKGSGDLLLSTADSLMSTRPDSALYLLENICISEIKAPAQKAKYALLLTQAQDKNYLCQALHFKDSYEAYIDSTKHIERTKEILAVEEETLLQQSEQKHRSNLSLYFYYIYAGGSFIIILIVFFAYKRIKYHQKTQQLKLEQESLLQAISTQSTQMKKDVENKDSEIAELRQKCSEYNEDKQYLDQLNSCLNELLNVKI